MTTLGSAARRRKSEGAGTAARSDALLKSITPLRDPNYQEKVGERIAKQIVHDFLDQHTEPGTSLPLERYLIEKYNAARFSVREGLRILEVLGLISIKTGRDGGPKLRQISSRDFARVSTFYYHIARASAYHLIEARVLLEPAIARLAANRGTREERNRVLEIVHMAAPDSSPASTVMPIYELHNYLAEMAHNPVITLLGRSLRDIEEARVGSRLPTSVLQRLQSDHEDIAKAVADGDGRLAEEHMQAHMSYLLKQLNSRFPVEMSQIVDWRD